MAKLSYTDYFFFGEENELKRFRKDFLMKSDEEKEKIGCFIGYTDEKEYPIIEKNINSQTVKGIVVTYETTGDSRCIPIQQWILDNQYSIKTLYIAYSRELNFCYSNDINKDFIDGDLLVTSCNVFEDFLDTVNFIKIQEIKNIFKKIESVMKSDIDINWQKSWKEFIDGEKTFKTFGLQNALCNILTVEDEENQYSWIESVKETYDEYDILDFVNKANEYAMLKDGYFAVIKVERKDDKEEIDFYNDTGTTMGEIKLLALESADNIEKTKLQTDTDFRQMLNGSTQQEVE